MKKVILSLAVLAVLAACGTGYHKKGMSGGYTDVALQENVFKITFTGNGYTDTSKATDFALLRAAEVAKENGYPYFFVYSAQDNGKTISRATTMSSALGSANYSGYGNARANYLGNTATVGYNEQGRVNANAFGTSSTTYQQEHKPSIEMVVVGINKPSPEVFTYKTDFLIKSLKKQYKIK